MKTRKSKKAMRRVARRFAKTSKSVIHPAFRRDKQISVREMTKRFAVRQDTLSRMTGFSPRAVAEWASGKEPSPPAKTVFTEINRFLDALARLQHHKEVGQWIKQPTP